MAADLTSLCDALGVDSFDLVGYSHGAIVCLIAATRESRIRRLVVGGIGAGAVELGRDQSRVVPQGMVDAMTAEYPSSLTDPRSAALRGLADAIGADRAALAALAESRHSTPIPLDRITAPTLILAGDRDPLAKNPEVLRAAVPGAQLRLLPDDHAGVLRSPEFIASVIGFLAD
jgi:pimeloyl-ACP methyl ester carboxylesterase